MKYKAFFAVFTIALIQFITVAGDKKKRGRQEIKYRGNIKADAPERAPKAGTGAGKKPVDKESGDSDFQGQRKNMLTSADDDGFSDSECPLCTSKKDKLKRAIESFWNHDLIQAYGCACQVLSARRDDGLAQAIVYAISNSRYAVIESQQKIAAPNSDPPALLNWEILGPFPVSKLEVDADPTFAFGIHKETEIDVGRYIMSLPSNSTVYSEFVSGAKVTWNVVQARPPNGQVDIRFPVAWNELGQGIGTTAVYEFQAWARIVTYARTSGFYTLQCVGAHTAYVRNDNNTRLVVGDIYQSQMLIAAIDLKVGPVGIIVPLRGAAQGSFYCRLSFSEKVMHVTGPMHVPNLLELPTKKEENKYFPLMVAPNDATGLMLSGLFSVVLHNLQGHPLSVDIQLEQPRGIATTFVCDE